MEIKSLRETWNEQVRDSFKIFLEICPKLNPRISVFTGHRGKLVLFNSSTCQAIMEENPYPNGFNFGHTFPDSYVT